MVGKRVVLPNDVGRGVQVVLIIGVFAPVFHCKRLGEIGVYLASAMSRRMRKNIGYWFGNFGIDLQIPELHFAGDEGFEVLILLGNVA